MAVGVFVSGTGVGVLGTVVSDGLGVAVSLRAEVVPVELGRGVSEEDMLDAGGTCVGGIVGVARGRANVTIAASRATICAISARVLSMPLGIQPILTAIKRTAAVEIRRSAVKIPIGCLLCCKR